MSERFGTVQRQVTARPVGQLQAYQQDVLIDPGAADFARGLEAFAETATGVVRQQREDDLDAQAAVADIGLDGYHRAMKGALDAQPELFDSPAELEKLDQEMRKQYLGGVTDDRILSRANMRLTNWLQSEGQTYQYAKAENQRFELGARTLQLSVDKLEEQRKAGTLTDEQASGQLKTLLGHLGTSPTFRMSKENREKLVQGLQDAYAKDGSRRVLLAKTFMDDPDLSIETRLALQADHAEALQATEAEKQAAKFELYKSWEPLIDKGRFSWDIGQQAVEAGLVSADDVRSSMRRQERLQKERIEKAQKETALVTGNPLTMDAKTFKAWEAQARSTLPKDQYYSLMRQTGGVNPAVKAQAERALSTATTPVETEDQIPTSFLTFMEGDATYLYGAGMLGQHIPPEQLEDTAVYLYATQSLGKSRVEAYNLLVNGAFSKYTDIDRQRLAQLKKELRDELDIDKDGSSNIVGATAGLAMKLVKATDMDPDEAKEWAIKTTKEAFVTTDYGPLPRSRFGSYTSEDALRKRLDFTAQETVKTLKADGHDVPKGDLRVMLLDDGRFTFVQKGGLTPVTSKAFRLMTDNATQQPDGTPTVEGERQEQLINEQFNDSRPNLSATQAWGAR